jgi:hypothetical protein
MTPANPKGGRAVMNRRLDPVDSLDFFPTPPWGTRSVLEHVVPLHLQGGSCWDGCAGEGHMAEVLREYFSAVHASDVHDYGQGYALGSFAGRADIPQAPAQCPFRPDWVFMNPPFVPALEFALRALDEASVGVALLVRTPWTEGVDRYAQLFCSRPPTTIAHFAERVPMVKGCWDPEASTATAYSWFVWEIAEVGRRTDTVWIPPGRRRALERADDRRRFAAWTFEDPASPDEEIAARALIKQQATASEMMAALGVSKLRLTRILRGIKKTKEAEAA